VQQRIDAGEHRGAATLFFDSLVEPWSTFTPAEQDMITTHALAFAGQLRDPNAITIDPGALSQVVAPVLLSEGERSNVAFGRILEQLGGLVPHSKRQVVPGAGHIPQQTHPEQYVDMVIDFVRAT
jgi:pimeloyl-ACP methyl ester carboxylesterase